MKIEVFVGSRRFPGTVGKLSTSRIDWWCQIQLPDGLNQPISPPKYQLFAPSKSITWYQQLQQHDPLGTAKWTSMLYLTSMPSFPPMLLLGFNAFLDFNACPWFPCVPSLQCFSLVPLFSFTSSQSSHWVWSCFFSECTESKTGTSNYMRKCSQTRTHSYI